MSKKLFSFDSPFLAYSGIRALQVIPDVKKGIAIKRLIFLSVFFFMCTFMLTAQLREISGTVSERGAPLPGVTIGVKGTNVAVVTDGNGRYQIAVPDEAVLKFSLMGMKTEEITVGERSTVNVEMSEEATQLSEVVVVAYGTALKESITGAVATVSSQSIEKRSLTSIAGVLDGQASGVLVNNSGTPGSSPTIRIRGFSTVNGDNSPLYVIDGIPLSRSTTEGNITDLNSQDIENISVLKDAASAALFGSRASNGVILITTKQGKNRGLTLRANAYMGMYTRGIPEYETLNAREFMEVMWTGYRNYLVSNPDMKDAANNRYTLETAAPFASENLVNSYLKYNIFDKPANQLFDQNGKLTANINPKYNDLDWWAPIERTGFRQDYTVSGDAISDKSKLYFSLGYLDEKSNIIYADYQRFTGRINVSITPKTWLQTGVSMNGSYQNFSNISDGNTGFVNPIYYARNMSPIYPIYEHDANGDFVLDAQGNRKYDDGSVLSRPQNLNRHILWELDLNRDKTVRSTLGSNAFAIVKFAKDFTFTVKGDVSLRNQENSTYSNSEIGDGKSQGRAGRTGYRYLDYTAMQQLAWDKNFDKHHVDILLGHENYSNNYVYTDLYKTTEKFANQYELKNFSEMVRLNGYDTNLRGESYLSRARYNYDSKYFVDASLRGDAVSRFHPDRRWGSFWSLGGSWSIHKEDFMASFRAINSLKIRASYGQVGNDASAARYAYMGLYDLSQNANIGALYKTQNEAANIKWESTNSTSVAIEGRLLNRLNFSAEWYNKLSHDLIFRVYNPLSAGATSTSAAESVQLKNIGDVVNRGVELSFDVDVMQRRDLTWNVSFTGAWQQNEVLTLPEQNRKDGIIDGTKKIMEGHSIYSYWLYQFAGVDRMNGHALYFIDDEKYYTGTVAVDGKTQIPDQYVVEINGKKYSEHYTYARRDWSGTSLPSFFGSFGSSLTWRNLTVSMLCTWSLGGKVFDQSYNSLMSVTSSPNSIHRDALKAWNGAPAGMTETSPDRIDPKGIPAIDWYRRSQLYSSSANNHLINASYLSIRNLNIAYRLPKRWVETIDLSDVSISLSGENLYTFTALKGLNPQQQLNGVTSNIMNYNRTISVGLNVKF
ncbi:MAG: SusC/RagA family TonB-linked outer membrane protein [Prevotellaceae bacterium]|jgi:TonB-linked SusC/RagA family outer membrane protein|nr:SusC/RagA family TonB-linked outer membrane protein [Prevotellaceae bacterium]